MDGVLRRRTDILDEAMKGLSRAAGWELERVRRYYKTVGTQQRFFANLMKAWYKADFATSDVPTLGVPSCDEMWYVFGLFVEAAAHPDRNRSSTALIGSSWPRCTGPTPSVSSRPPFLDGPSIRNDCESYPGLYDSLCTLARITRYSASTGPLCPVSDGVWSAAGPKAMRSERCVCGGVAAAAVFSGTLVKAISP